MMVDKDLTIEARVDGYEIYASRLMIVDGRKDFILLPIPGDPDFKLTISIRIVAADTAAHLWIEAGEDKYPRVVIESPFTTVENSAASFFKRYAEDDGYTYHINFFIGFVGDEGSFTVHFTYVLARKAK